MSWFLYLPKFIGEKQNLYIAPTIHRSKFTEGFSYFVLGQEETTNTDGASALMSHQLLKEALNCPDTLFPSPNNRSCTENSMTDKSQQHIHVSLPLRE